jgi:hypothetical protein
LKNVLSATKSGGKEKGWRNLMTISDKEWAAVADQLNMKGNELRRKCTSVISRAGGQGFIKKRSFVVSLENDGKLKFPSVVSNAFWLVDPVKWTATCHNFPAGTPAGSKAGTNACGHRLPPSSTGGRR